MINVDDKNNNNLNKSNKNKNINLGLLAFIKFKMKKYIFLSFFTLSFGSFFVLYQNCSDVNLSKFRSNAFEVSQINIDLCTVDASTIRSNLKFIFAVDRSGSNQSRKQGTLPGTDMTGDRRFKPLENFVSNFKTDQYVHWSLITFNSSATLVQKFTNDKDAFLAVVKNEHNHMEKDREWTNYQDTLRRIKDDLIIPDINNSKKLNPIISSNYVIFFVSDGAPIVNGYLQDPNDIINSIKSIISLKDNQAEVIEGIQIHTGLYYPDATNPENDAKGLLTDISKNGNGDYIEFGSGQEIDFGQFAIPTRIQRYSLEQVWVQNMNTLWENGQLYYDGDGDLLSDTKEYALGSNPIEKDSDGNGVSDGVEYKLTGLPCKDTTCDTAKADPVLRCKGLIFNLDTNGKKVYSDSDNDGLNDCDELLLGSDYKNFDSNGDWVPDSFAFSKEIEFIKGSSNLYVDTDQDLVNNYQELKANTPIDHFNGTIAELQKINWYITKFSDDGKQSCYNVGLDHLVYMGAANKIRVYELESTTLIGAKRIIRQAEKNLDGRGQAYFTTDDFK